MLTHQEKITWMALWASKNKVTLSLEGSVGFGRDCVGIITGDKYPDYEWYDQEYDRIDGNGEVWVPDDAYHKHPCVAVLGHGEHAESQLYEWLKWFDDNGFGVECGSLENTREFDPLELRFGMHKYARMVRKTDKGAKDARG